MTCLHMWSGLHITPEGYIHLCGVSKEQVLGFTPPHIADIENLQDFFNSEYFVNYRNTKIEENKFCIACVTRESSGIKSLRQMLPRRYHKNDIHTKFDVSECKIEHLDVCFNNLCNQQCVMCKSECSSKWYMADKANEYTEFKRRPVKYKKWTTKINMDKIISILPELKILQIKGGEPLIQEEVKQILLYIKNHKLKTKIEILSNFQEISTEMMDILHGIENLSVRVSLDSSGKMYEWTRGGNWTKTIENLRTYAKNCQHKPDISYTNTLNRWSFKNLVQDIDIVESVNSEFCVHHNNYNILLVIGPRYTSPFAAPLEERLAFIKQFEKKFGIIDKDNIKYRTLKLNHLYNIQSLKNNPLNIDDNLIQLSNKWEETINKMRQ